MIRRPAVFAIGLVTAGACFLPGRGREAPVPRQSATRDSLLAFDRSRNDSLPGLGLAEAMRPYLDPTVIYMRAGAHTAYGADAALRLLGASQPRTAPFIAWQPVGGGISRDGHSGYTFGIAVRATPEQPGAFIERYIAYWSRRPNGRWRISGYLEVSPGVLSAAGERKAPAATPPSVRDLLAADSAFADMALVMGPAAAVREAFSDEGVLLGAGQLLVGPLAIGDYFESRRSFSINWVPRDGRIAESADLGFTVGDAAATSLGPTGAATQRFTKYLTVWRKIDGRWRVVVTGGNERPSPIGD